MKIAIHHRPSSFSDRWIAYCDRKNISYKVVNAFDSDIIQKLHDCDALMWHHHHGIYKDIISAKKILFALEHSGIKVFPDFKTGWHFDDKVAQKYLLEAIGAPLVPSYVFYDKQEAIDWVRQASFPKVFKLKGGAGAANVRLVKSSAEALKLISKAFGKGFPQFDRFANLKERVNRFKQGQDNFVGVLKALARLLVITDYAKHQENEKHYVYFQDFIPDNDSDIRIVVIGKKYAACERRFVRKGDFRASGSGNYSYDSIDPSFIDCAFKTAEKLDTQSVAFDFIQNENGQPFIVEMSYGFGTAGISQAPGYWTKDLTWYNEKATFQEWMIEGILKEVTEK